MDKHIQKHNLLLEETYWLLQTTFETLLFAIFLDNWNKFPFSASSIIQVHHFSFKLQDMGPFII